jgi:hypothetical protein
MIIQFVKSLPPLKTPCEGIIDFKNMRMSLTCLGSMLYRHWK